MSTDFGSHPSTQGSRYEFRGAMLTAPRDWTEESLLSISAPGAKPQPTVTLVRLTVPVDMTLELFAARRVADLSTMVASLRVEESRDTVFGGQRGIQLRLFWEELEGRVFQRLLITRWQDAMFVLSLNCFEAQVPRAQTIFEGVIASFKLPPPPLGASR